MQETRPGDEHFPIEHFIEIKNDEFRMGRIVIFLMTEGHDVEIDIVQKESKKIWHHVGRLYQIEDYQEAVHLGVQKLAGFLKGSSD